jgi:molybdate transport system substrate-binding protein
MVAAGAADLGFVALAQVQTPAGIPGSHWLPPPALYAPIEQSAVALARATDPEAVRHFLDWLQTDATARRLITQAGYGRE